MNNQDKYIIKLNLLSSFISFFLFTFIVLHSTGVTLYWIPFFTSGVWFYNSQKKYKPHILKIFKVSNLSVFLAISTAIFIAYFSLFLGLDKIPNHFHFDFIHYGSLADHLGKIKTETIQLQSQFSFNFGYIKYQLYHYTEIWFSGIIGNYFNIPSIQVLLLFTYPLFLIISIHVIYLFVNAHLLPISYSKYCRYLVVYFTIIVSITFIQQKLHIPKLDIFTSSISSVFLTSAIKLTPILIIITQLYTLILNHNTTSNNVVTLISIGFLYPTVLPSIVALFILFKIFQKLNIKTSNLLLVYACIISLFVFSKWTQNDFLYDITRHAIIDLVRFAGLIALFYLFKNSQNKYNAIVLSNMHIQMILFFCLISIPLYLVKPHITYDFDYYQILDNLSNVNSQLMLFLFLLFMLHQNIHRAFTVSILIIIPLFLNIIPKNIEKSNANTNIVSNFNRQEREIKVLIIKDTINPIVQPYFENAYNFLVDKDIAWNTKHLHVINQLYLKPAVTQKHLKHNQMVDQFNEKFHDPDSIIKYQFQNIPIQDGLYSKSIP